MGLALWYVWLLTRFFGAVFGLFVLRAIDEGLWDDALLKGSMMPPPTPENRMKFVMLCTALPEIPMAMLLTHLLRKR